MPIVSISEAARLTGKSRRTLHRHIDTGKISKSHTQSGDHGIDTSELIRVYGELKTQPATNVTNKKKLQHDTHDDTECTPNIYYDTNQKDTEIRRIYNLEKEVENLNLLLASKQETIDSLKTALKLLEYRQEKKEPIETYQEKAITEPQKQDISIEIKSQTRFWKSFKNIFK